MDQDKPNLTGFYKGRAHRLEEREANILRVTILILGVAAFTGSMIACGAEDLGHVNHWEDSQRATGIVKLGMYSICRKDFAECAGCPITRDPEIFNMCVSYQSTEGNELMTNYNGYHNAINVTTRADGECDDNNFFMHNADGEDTAFCHVRNTAAVFGTIAGILNFFAMLGDVYIMGKDTRGTEATICAMYVASTFCSVIAYGAVTSFLDKWLDADIPADSGVIIDRGVSLGALLWTWCLTCALIFLVLGKMHLIHHDGDVHPDEFKKPKKFQVAKHRDNKMYTELLTASDRATKMAVELDELLNTTDPSYVPEPNSSDDEMSSEEEEEQEAPAASPAAGGMVPAMMGHPGMMMGHPGMMPQMQHPGMMSMQHPGMMQQPMMMVPQSAASMMPHPTGMVPIQQHPAMVQHQQPMMMGHPGMMPQMQQPGMVPAAQPMQQHYMSTA